MSQMPTSPYVELRARGYYLAGTRISLDSIAYALRRGETVEDILADFPVLESRERLEGAIAFIQAHPKEVEAYLADAEKIWTNCENRIHRTSSRRLENIARKGSSSPLEDRILADADLRLGIVRGLRKRERKADFRRGAGTDP